MSRISSGWEALQQRLRQSVETRRRKHRYNVHNRNTEALDPGENIADYWEHVETTPLVRASLLNFALEVAEPGLRLVEGDDRAISYLEDEWLPQSAIIAGERHKPFDPLIPLTTIQRWGRGGMMLEHVRANPEDINSPITGVNPIRPESGRFVTLPNRDIIVEPEDLETGAIENPLLTKRGEPAAFVQWHSEAIRTREDRDTVPLSINDFTRSIFSPGMGDGSLQDNSVWGEPVTQTIDEDVTEFKNTLRDLHRAIEGKAWGLWSIEFGRDTIEYEDGGKMVTEIIEWSESDQDDFVDEHLDDLDPGGIVTHDGTINPDRLDSEVPDLIDELEFYVSNITSVLPTPKYVVGFERNINQFVTQGQEERYELYVSTERKALGTFFTELFRTVVEQNTTFPVEGLEARVEPPEEESPILSLGDEEVDRIERYAQALERLSGTMEPAMLVDEDVLRDLILQLPEDAAPDLDESLIDESDDEVQDQIADLEERMAGVLDEGDGEDEDEQEPPEPPIPADD